MINLCSLLPVSVDEMVFAMDEMVLAVDEMVFARNLECHPWEK